MSKYLVIAAALVVLAVACNKKEEVAAPAAVEEVPAPAATTEDVVVAEAPEEVTTPEATPETEEKE